MPISGVNPTPRTTAVYASDPALPRRPQDSLPSRLLSFGRTRLALASSYQLLLSHPASGSHLGCLTANRWPRVQDFRFGQPGIGDFPYPLPCGLISLAASFERAPPDFNHMASERHERREVCRHGVVGEETPDHLLKPLPLLGYGIVSSPA